VEWQTKGLPVRTKGVGSTERKIEETLWRELEADVLVRVHRSMGRRTHVKFTFPGEIHARRLAASGDVVCSWDHFRTFAESRSDGGPVSEAVAAGCAPWKRTPEQIKRLTEQCFNLLPFLCSGWITSWPDGGGRHWLQLTHAGRAAFEAGCPSDPCSETGLDEAASDLYEAIFKSYSADLTAMTPRQGAPIVIPIAVGMNWGGYRD
jgi:hypothetical protein